ncbi:MAG: DUF2520 domain-containing protein [Marinilabiliales bacterium]|nr:MAG: DUF2520 domain-containing protein [Marinilabiliales bacterium]
MIGAGNVAAFLASSLHAAGHCIEMVYSRTAGNAEKLGKLLNSRYTCNTDDIRAAQGIQIAAIPDEALIKFSEKGLFGKGMILHTAGSIPMSILSGCSSEYGVLYPLQTLTAGRNLREYGVPFCIEAGDEASLERIRDLASSVSDTVYELDSESRMMLHLAAVFASNFTNHMYVLAGKIAARAGVPFEILHPLVMETAKKASESSPAMVQTGPAARNDMIIIKKHLDLLSFSPELKHLYRLISDSIIEAKAENSDSSSD